MSVTPETFQQLISDLSAMDAFFKKVVISFLNPPALEVMTFRPTFWHFSSQESVGAEVGKGVGDGVGERVVPPFFLGGVPPFPFPEFGFKNRWGVE